MIILFGQLYIVMDLFVIFRFFILFSSKNYVSKITSTKMTTGLEICLCRIYLNTRKNTIENKKDWYKVGKALLQGEKVWLHNESKVGVKRTYRLYSIMKGNWEGPSPKMLSKMNKARFDEVLENHQLDNLMAELQNQFDKEYWWSNIFLRVWTC